MKIHLPAFVGSLKTIPSRKDWPSAVSHDLSWRSVLDIDDVTVAGLQLRVEAHELLEDEAVRVQLEYHPPRGKCEPLARVEWRPLSYHNNKHRGPTELRLRPFRSTHVHPFEFNWLEAENRMLTGNLPIALPLQDVDSYKDFLDICGGILNISNMLVIPVPPWRPRML